MTLEDTFDIPAHVIAREVSGETVILNLESGTYYGLDPVGAFIWQLLTRGESLRNICYVLPEEFEVDTETAQRDLESLIDDLVDRKLVMRRLLLTPRGPT